MTDSPAEKKPEADKAKGVPIQRFAEVNNERKEAQAEADRLRAELDQVKGSAGNVDMEQLIAKMAEANARAIAAAVATHVAPIQQKLGLAETAMRHGLDENQARAVQEIQQKYPGLPEDRALVLAQIDKPDLFPRPGSRGYDPSFHGSLPPGGDTGVTNLNKPPSEYKQKVAAAIAARDTPEVERLATDEFFRVMEKHSPSARR